MKQGILWINDAGVWKRADTFHPQGRDNTGWKEPFEIYVRDATEWYEAWPLQRPVATYPPVGNLRVTSVSSSEIHIAWDTPTPTPLNIKVWQTNKVTGVTQMQIPVAGTITVAGFYTGPAETYILTVIPGYTDGDGAATSIEVTAGSAVPPSITYMAGVSHNQARVDIAGTPPFTLTSTYGYRNGTQWNYTDAGTKYIGGCSGTEYFIWSNAGGTAPRIRTDAGTPATAPVAGTIYSSLLNPPPWGRGVSYGIDWGVPAMAAHVNFPYSNINDGTGASRFQTGNYPRGWVQHQIRIYGGCRLRRMAFTQGEGAGNVETICPVYSFDGGYNWKRWSHGMGQWIPWDSGGVNPGNSTDSGLLGISSGGSWDRDWNWRYGDASTLWTPYVPESGTDLSERDLYIRWGLVHMSGSFGANIGECWIEYQSPSTPGAAEVLCLVRYD